MRRKPRKDAFKSQFEADVAAYYGAQVEYEPDRIEFEQPAAKRHYVPDFKIKKNVYIETKGKLSIEDRKKHVWFKAQHPEITIIFLFMNSQNKLTRNSKTTYAMWAEDNGIPYFCWKTKVPPQNIKELLKLKSTRQLKDLMAQSSSKEILARKKLVSA